MVAARISSAEVLAQVENRFVDKVFEAILVNAPATTYTPGTTNDATFLSNEITFGTGGYRRQIISYASGDVGSYADQGIGLVRKSAVFTHDGSGTNMDFSHIVLAKGNGNVLTTGTPTAKPSNGVNGTYLNLPTTTAGSGKGLIVSVTVANAGSALSDWAVTVVNRGYGYTASDVINVANSALVTAGATTGTGNLVFPVSTVTTGGGQIVGVSKADAAVTLGGGNQAVFYFDVKQFGYYTA
jgi:hypothetical protein